MRLPDLEVKIILNLFKGTICASDRSINIRHGKFFRRRNASQLALEFSIQDVRRRKVELQWEVRLALEQEWMELYVDMPQEIEVLLMNHAECI